MPLPWERRFNTPYLRVERTFWKWVSRMAKAAWGGRLSVSGSVRQRKDTYQPCPSDMLALGRSVVWMTYRVHPNPELYYKLMKAAAAKSKSKSKPKNRKKLFKSPEVVGYFFLFVFWDRKDCAQTTLDKGKSDMCVITMIDRLKMFSDLIFWVRISRFCRVLFVFF